MNFPKKQAQRLIPEYLLDYTTKLQNSHPDPTDSWGGGSNYTSGDGIDITNNVISVDNTVAKKSEIPTKTSELTNDSGFTTQTWVENQGYSKFSGSYNDLNDKPDLSIYAQSSNLSTVATTGSYNDLIDKPTIPDTTNLVTTNTVQTITGAKTFQDGLFTEDTTFRMKMNIVPDKFDYHCTFSNGEKHRTLFALPVEKATGTEQTPTMYTLATTDDIPSLNGYATEQWVTNQGYSTFSGSYNDLTDKPTLATVATSGSYNDLLDKPTIPDTSKFVTTDTVQTISGAKTFNGGLITENTTFGIKMNIVPSRFDYTYNNQGTIEKTLFDLPTGKTPGTEQQPTNYTIATTDDIHNPTITFTQGGTTKGTITLNQSGDQTIEFDAGGGGGGSTTNMVTTDTNQEITGEKTFVGNKRIKFKQSSQNDRIGFTGFDANGTEIGYLEMSKSDGDFTGRPTSNMLGYWSNVNSGPNPSSDVMLGFKYFTKDSDGNRRNYKLVVPPRYNELNATRYIPISVNGNTADNTGNITVNASSTSTLTPTTETLVFTLSDNSTVEVNVMTSATVSTTTTLS